MNYGKLKVHELADILKISDGNVSTILHYIWICESSVKSGCRVSSQPIKNDNELTHQRSVWHCYVKSQQKSNSIVDMRQ